MNWLFCERKTEGITRKDIEQLRNRLKIGQELVVRVLSPSFEADGKYPTKRRRLKVCHISRWVVILQDPETGRKYSEQLKQIMIDRRGRKHEERH